jgi:hypothetical protein
VATVDMVMRFNESPAPIPEGMLQAGFETKIMHAQLRVGWMVKVPGETACEPAPRRQSQ